MSDTIAALELRSSTRSTTMVTVGAWQFKKNIETFARTQKIAINSHIQLKCARVKAFLEATIAEFVNRFPTSHQRQ